MAHSGFPRREGGNLLFSQIFSWKLDESERNLVGGGNVSGAPLDPIFVVLWRPLRSDNCIVVLCKLHEHFYLFMCESNSFAINCCFMEILWFINTFYFPTNTMEADQLFQNTQNITKDRGKHYRR